MSVLCFLALRAVAQCASPAEAIKHGRSIVANLCGHSGQRLPEDFLRRSVMAAFLLSILQKSGFFGQRKTESGEWMMGKQLGQFFVIIYGILWTIVKPTNEELEVTGVLLGLLQVVQFNAHEIYETKLGENHR